MLRPTSHFFLNSNLYKHLYIHFSLFLLFKETKLSNCFPLFQSSILQNLWLFSTGPLLYPPFLTLLLKFRFFFFRQFPKISLFELRVAVIKTSPLNLISFKFLWVCLGRTKSDFSHGFLGFSSIPKSGSFWDSLVYAIGKKEILDSQ